MRYLPIVLLIGILSNFLCLVVFRLKLDRKYDSRFADLSTSLNEQLVSFSTASLARIDNYFRSNLQSRVNSSFSSTASLSKDDYDPKSVLFLDSGECDYYYYLFNGEPFARIGISDFRVGNPFPRGGSITAIFPDCLIVDNSLLFRNRSFSSYSPFSSRSSSFSSPSISENNSIKPYKPLEELSNVKSTN